MKYSTCLVRCPPSNEIIPFGLVCIYSFLRAKGHNVTFFDFNTRNYGAKQKNNPKHNSVYFMLFFLLKNAFLPKKLKRPSNLFDIDLALKKIELSGCGIIAFSVNVVNLYSSIELAKKIKEKDKSKIIVFGGPSCNISSIEFFKEMKAPVDFLVTGEGEPVLNEIVTDFEKGKLKKVYPGSVSFNGDRCIFGGEAEPLDMNILPFPDFSALGLKKLDGIVPIEMSRGCKGNCVFCSQKNFWKGFRKKSGKRVGMEIQHLKQKYDAKYFSFSDSAIDIDHEEFKAFCEYIIRNDINISWVSNFMIQGVTKEEISLAKESGCEFMFFGIESCSQRLLNLMRKGNKVSDYSKVLKMAKSNGVKTGLNILIGFPGERLSDIIRTLGFLVKNRKNYHFICLNILLLKKNSDLYKLSDLFGIKNSNRYLWRTSYFLNNFFYRLVAAAIFVTILKFFRKDVEINRDKYVQAPVENIRNK